MVTTNTITANRCCPMPSASPPTVEVMTDGKRATVEMNTHVDSFMCVMPAQ